MTDLPESTSRSSNASNCSRSARCNPVVSPRFFSYVIVCASYVDLFVSHQARSRDSLPSQALAFYVERNVRPRRLDDATRIALVALARVIDWRPLLTIVRPDTLVRWHRQGFRLFWRWKSRCPGRPRIPRGLQDLIAAMARAKQTWGEARIAAELLLKLGVSVSPRTVRRYMRRPVPSRPRPSSQTWRTFVGNHSARHWPAISSWW